VAKDEFVIHGLDKLRLKIRGIQGEQLLKEMEETTQKAVLYVHGQVPSYPPPPSMSTYRRTGTLGRQITTEVRTAGSSVLGVIGSPTPYSPWVISSETVPSGEGPQAEVHKGRWWTLQKVVEDARETVIGFYKDMIDRLLSRE
jgi:hypothetical protein